MYPSLARLKKDPVTFGEEVFDLQSIHITVKVGIVLPVALSLLYIQTGDLCLFAPSDTSRRVEFRFVIDSSIWLVWQPRGIRS